MVAAGVTGARENILAQRAGHPGDQKNAALPFVRLREIELTTDVQHLVEDLLPKRGVGVIAGHSGTGKSFLASSLAAAIAMNRPFGGRHVEGGPVIYIAAEGARGMRNRLLGMIEEGELSREAPVFVIELQVDLQATDRKDAERVAATVREIVEETGCDPAMIVIDTISKTFGAGKENTDDMVGYVRNLGWLEELFQCFILAIHHRPKDSDNRSFRGHGSLLAGVDMAAMIDGGPIKTLTIEKQKDGETGLQIRFKLDQLVLGQDRRGKDITTCVVRFLDHEGEREDRRAMLRRKLSPQSRAALEAIETLIHRDGVDAPADVPADLINRYSASRAIRSGQVADRLQQQFMAGQHTAADMQADSAARAARRAISKLKDAGILGSWGEWLWIS
jgi:hypothetical protein